MLRHYTLLILVLLATTRTARSDTQFLYPAEEGLEFHYRDVVNVTYESNITSPYLYTFCTQGVANLAQTEDDAAGNNATTTVTLTFSKYGGQQCWFNIRAYPVPDSSALDKNSVAFNYVNKTRNEGPSTFALTQTTTRSSSTAQTTTLASTTQTTVSSFSETASPSSSTSTSGLSAGAVAGIAIAAAISGIGIAVGAIFAMRRRRRRHGATGYGTVEYSGHDDDQKGAFMAPPAPHEMPTYYGNQEGSQPPAMLDGRETRPQIPQELGAS